MYIYIYISTHPIHFRMHIYISLPLVVQLVVTATLLLHPSTLHHQGVGSPSAKEGGSHCAGWGSFAKLGNHMNMMIE